MKDRDRPIFSILYGTSDAFNFITNISGIFTKAKSLDSESILLHSIAEDETDEEKIQLKIDLQNGLKFMKEERNPYIDVDSPTHNFRVRKSESDEEIDNYNDFIKSVEDKIASRENRYQDIILDTSDVLTYENPAEEVDFETSSKQKNVISGNPKSLVAYATSHCTCKHCSVTYKTDDYPRRDAEDECEMSEFKKCLLVTYPLVMSHVDMIDYLLFRYYIFQDHEDATVKNKVKEFFEKVIENLPPKEINANLLRAIVSIKLDVLKNIGFFLYGILCRKILEAKQLIDKMYSIPDEHLSKPFAKNLSIFKPVHIAEQLTLNDATLYKQIEPVELLNWLQYGNYKYSPNLEIFIDRFNNMSYWLQYQLLYITEEKERDEYGRHLTKVMKHLRKLNNFSSYSCILSALNSTIISRMNWKAGFKAELRGLSSLLDMSKSFHNYRTAVEKASLPYIPYIGMIMQDITFIDQGNKTKPKNINHSVNFRKNLLLYKNLVLFLKPKSSLYKYVFPYDQAIEEVFNDFKNYGKEVLVKLGKCQNHRPASSTNTVPKKHGPGSLLRNSIH